VGRTPALQPADCLRRAARARLYEYSPGFALLYEPIYALDLSLEGKFWLLFWVIHEHAPGFSDQWVTSGR
jgi:hypothetical protein